MSDFAIAFWLGVFVGLFSMGVLATCIPGIGYHEAEMSKAACERSLPRYQVCVPNYVPSPQKDKP